MVTSQDVADQAELLVGSRWQRNGRGPGLDCAGLVVVSATNAGLSIQDCRSYDVRCPPAGLMTEFCMANGDMMSSSVRDPGTVVLIRIPGFAGVSHMGIVSSYDRVIHMDASRRRVVVESFDWLDAKCHLTMKLHGCD